MTEINYLNNFLTELAIWLVGSAIVVDGDDLAVSTLGKTAIIHTDCLLNIIIENAQDNQDILLPTLQFVEVCFKMIEFSFKFINSLDISYLGIA